MQYSRRMYWYFWWQLWYTVYVHSRQRRMLYIDDRYLVSPFLHVPWMRLICFTLIAHINVGLYTAYFHVIGMLLYIMKCYVLLLRGTYCVRWLSSVARHQAANVFLYNKQTLVHNVLICNFECTITVAICATLVVVGLQSHNKHLLKIESTYICYTCICLSIFSYMTSDWVALNKPAW